ncbi:unnamed protein product [Mytilus edulis]|uniref:Uncharacterized protein n=1 Tax=Mytilus edulis TaxID=6550 RepID=A0A8S3TQZ7_MYTED|nr:unnamed protein product [Mytilus edulis]
MNLNLLLLLLVKDPQQQKKPWTLEPTTNDEPTTTSIEPTMNPAGSENDRTMVFVIWGVIGTFVSVGLLVYVICHHKRNHSYTPILGSDSPTTIPMVVFNPTPSPSPHTPKPKPVSPSTPERGGDQEDSFSELDEEPVGKRTRNSNEPEETPSYVAEEIDTSIAVENKEEQISDGDREQSPDFPMLEQDTAVMSPTTDDLKKNFIDNKPILEFKDNMIETRRQSVLTRCMMLKINTNQLNRPLQSGHPRCPFYQAWELHKEKSYKT